ncbi:MAG TPA: 6-pyruvoyl tetrahydropterin synthase family protein [Candidatus Methanomethylophilaceae archaeon]|nr:6-pyruvoyl tetrahydropterin synthase family protein [Candidatus Methanomethylophilaceae archaeon]
MRLEIDGEYSGIRFSACHFIPKHEKCSRLHGHSYVVRLRLEGDINDNGMLMDFVILKKELRSIMSSMDHRTLLPASSKDVKLTIIDDSVEVNTCGKRYVFPLEDVVILDLSNTTAEEMAKLMVRQMIQDVEFPENIHSVSIGLDEERGQTAWYTEELR